MRAATRRGVGAAPALQGLRAVAAGTEAAALKAKIQELSAGTDAGVKASPELRAEINALIADLKALNPTPTPADSDLLDGRWRVRYSTAPPPSNGQLGPFIGSAFQSVDLKGGVYTNLLVVGEEASGGWLKAVLKADWEVLDSQRWKVFFRTLDISVLGVRVVGQTWEENTRIWDMGYLDADTRIVFGARDEDSESVVFYMTRE